MSSEIAIEAQGLAKAYLIYNHPSDRLKQAIVPRLRSLLHPITAGLRRSLPERQYYQMFWALQGISFDVVRGETVGIIGRNGSGKSTLLQLVCQTLAPTLGNVSVRGRVGALLELGSGFNPEYTGRENVFLNASILGLSDEETRARLDDILAFAEIGDFIDHPIKTYSSGMAMRLAFAVIAHVDADILVIDEALAVGDAAFQQKCLRWLRRFRENGTVLFCSHDIGAVMNFCNRAIWLDKGQIKAQGPAKDVCEAYTAYVQALASGLPETAVQMAEGISPPAAGTNEASRTEPPSPPEPGVREPVPPADDTAPLFKVGAHTAGFGTCQATILEAGMTRPDGSSLPWIKGGEDIVISARIRAHATLNDPIVGFSVKDRLGQHVLGDNTVTSHADCPPTVGAGKDLLVRFGFTLPWLASGPYSVTIAIASGTLDAHVQHHWVHDAFTFQVHSPYRNGVMIGVPMRSVTMDVLAPTRSHVEDNRTTVVQ